MTIYTLTWACYNINNYRTDRLSAGSAIYKTLDEAKEHLDEMIKEDIHIAIEGDERYDNDEFETKHLRELIMEYTSYKDCNSILMDYPNDSECLYIINEVNT